MRLLAVYPYVPYPLDRGACYRGYHLLRELARTHDIDLVALAEDGEGLQHRPVFTAFCHRVEIVPFQHPAWQKLFPKRLLNPLPATVVHWTLPQAAKTLGRLLSTERYDAVHVFDVVLAQFFLRDHTRVPLIADRTRVDLQYQLMERRRLECDTRARLLNLEHLCKLWLYERRVARRTAFQIVCGPDDLHFIRRYIHRNLRVAVVPNGVDTSFFHPEACPGERPSVHPTILFCGAMDYTPNIDALRWYFSEIHDVLVRRCPNLHVLIVGKAPGPEVQNYGRKSNVIVTGAIPDVRPFYARSWLQIVPLRIGGGTRLKIVESMAMGTPVVSTSIGAQGLHLQHERDILLADSPGDFVRETARALDDGALRGALRMAGLRTVSARLSWPILGRQLSDLYSASFKPPRPASRMPSAAAMGRDSFGVRTP
jgi:polysaccharide biosynthesis protein PslH